MHSRPRGGYKMTFLIIVFIASMVCSYMLIGDFEDRKFKEKEEREDNK